MDLETGLPEVPEGYYWRVERSLMGGEWPLRVNLMRRTTKTITHYIHGFWRTKTREENREMEGCAEFELVTQRRINRFGVKGAVFMTAEDLIKRIERDKKLREYQQKQEREIKGVLGDYPPKNLWNVT